MFPVRADDSENRDYHNHLALIRARILGFARRKLTPYQADFAQVEDVAQACVVALWRQYPEKRDLAEMTAIAIGIARHKIAQFRREQSRETGAVPIEPGQERREPSDPFSGDRLLDRVAAREHLDHVLLAMLRLSPRCREILRLKLLEQKDYAEIRLLLGISGNIYEMTKRCHKTLLQLAGGHV
jgi:RNA polymerase sigma factor (sigma-70 family)